MCLLRLALITIYFFPHLFPDFVAHAITNDTLETPLSNNLPNIEETTTNPSRFPSPIQKEGALIAGYVLYWTVVRFRVTLSACTFFWLHISRSKC